MPDQLLLLRRALRDNQEDTNWFVMAREGMIPREKFFNPENLQRILRRAGVRSTSTKPMPSDMRSRPSIRKTFAAFPLPRAECEGHCVRYEIRIFRGSPCYRARFSA